MTILLPSLAIGCAAFCVWLTVWIINRKERCAKRALAGIVVAFPVPRLSSKPIRFHGVGMAFAASLALLIAAVLFTSRIDDDLPSARQYGLTVHPVDDQPVGELLRGEPITADAFHAIEVHGFGKSHEEQIAKVAAAIEKLNPGFDGTMLSCSIERGAVVGVELSANVVKDLSPLSSMSELRRLICRGGPGRGQLADLSPLQGLRLTYLDCSDTCVDDLSPLIGMPLETLHIDGTLVGQLSPLRRMPLHELHCARTTVFDLSPLTGLPLQILDCQRTRIDDLSPLRWRRLTHLHCGRTRVIDLAPLKGMPLQELTVCTTPVFDLTPLIGMPLRRLDFRFTRVDTLVPLNRMPLSELKCGASQVCDLSPLKNMKLMILDCSNTRIEDLSPLSNLPIVSLDCADTHVTDLSPLRNLALTDLKCDFDARRDDHVLRSITTLRHVNGISATAFWGNNPQ